VGTGVTPITVATTDTREVLIALRIRSERVSGQAKRNLDPEGLRTAMKGKTWNASAARALVDEDPRAYKDIRKVMADQSDLTAVVHVLHQVLNYKGTSAPGRRPGKIAAWNV